MTVRELIESLLDYDMDYETEVELDLPTRYEQFDFDFEESPNDTVSLQVNLRDYELVEKGRLDYLEELEDEVNG